MKIFKELKKLGYKHYTEHTLEELDNLPLNSEERIMEQALVLRWFREKYQLFASVVFVSKEYFYEIRRNGEQFIYMPESYKTYEEAELACLRTLIEIVKKETN